MCDPQLYHMTDWITPLLREIGPRDIFHRCSFLLALISQLEMASTFRENRFNN